MFVFGWMPKGGMSLKGAAQELQTSLWPPCFGNVQNSRTKVAEEVGGSKAPETVGCHGCKLEALWFPNCHQVLAVCSKFSHQSGPR